MADFEAISLKLSLSIEYFNLIGEILCLCDLIKSQHGKICMHISTILILGENKDLL